MYSSNFSMYNNNFSRYNSNFSRYNSNFSRYSSNFSQLNTTMHIGTHFARFSNHGNETICKLFFMGRWFGVDAYCDLLCY
jgi:hypothetical protein